MEDSKLRKVYDTIVKEGYDVPDFATFETDMRDDNKLTQVRDRLVEDGYELPEFGQFKIDMFGAPQEKAWWQTEVNAPKAEASPYAVNPVEFQAQVDKEEKEIAERLPRANAAMSQRMLEGQTTQGAFERFVAGDTYAKKGTPEYARAQSVQARHDYAQMPSEAREKLLEQMGGKEKLSAQFEQMNGRQPQDEMELFEWRTGGTAVRPEFATEKTDANDIAKYNGYSANEINAGMADEKAVALYTKEKLAPQLAAAQEKTTEMLKERDAELQSAYYDEYRKNAGIPGYYPDDTSWGGKGRTMDKDWQMLKAAENINKETEQLVDAAVNDRKFFTGFGRTIANIDTWFPVMSGLELSALQELKDVDPEKASPAQKALMEALALRASAEASYAGDISNWYKMGEGVANMVPLWFEMAFNPLSGVGKVAAKKAISSVATAGTKSAMRKILQQGAIKGAGFVGSLAGGAGMAATTSLPKVAVNAGLNSFGQAQYDINAGDIEFGGAKAGDGYWTEFGKEFARQAIEHGTEQMGAEWLSKAIGKPLGWAGKAVSKIPGVGKAVKRTEQFLEDALGEKYELLKNLAKDVKYDGPLEELGEEFESALMRVPVDGWDSLTEFFNGDNLLVTLGTVVTPFVSGVTLAGGYNVLRGNYKAGAREYGKQQAALRRAETAFGENQEALKNITFNLNNADTFVEEMRSVYNSKELTNEQKFALLEYGVNTLKYMAATGSQINLDENTQMLNGMLRESYSWAYENTAPEAVNGNMVVAADKALREAESAAKTALGLQSDTSIEDFVGNRSVDEVAMGDDAVAEALRRYYAEKALFEGMQDKMQDTRENEYTEADKSVDTVAHEDGNVYMTTLPSTGEKIFITGGKVVLDSEGYIDVNQSEGLVALMPDGTKGAIQPGQIREKVSVENADAQKAAKRAEIDARYKQQLNTFTYTDKADGTEHTVQLVSRGEQMARVILDGVEQDIPNNVFDEIVAEATAEASGKLKGESGEQEAENAESGDVVSPVETTQAVVEQTALERVPKAELTPKQKREEVAKRIPMKGKERAWTEAEPADVVEYISLLTNDPAKQQAAVDKFIADIKAKQEKVDAITALEMDEDIAFWDGVKQMLAEKAEPVAEVAPVESAPVVEETQPTAKAQPIEQVAEVAREESGSSEIPNNQEPLSPADSSPKTEEQLTAPVEVKAEGGNAPGQSGVRLYSQEELAKVKEQLGKLDATTAPAFAKRLFSIRGWNTLEEANNALKELLASYGDALHGESAAILPFLDEAQKLIADYKAAVKEPTFTEEVLENGDKRITNYNSRGEVETVATERNGKVVSVDNYDEGVLFETTTYDENGVSTSVTRYDKSGNVVAKQEFEKNGKPNVNTHSVIKSENEKKALRKRAEKWAKKLGVRVNVLESYDEVTDEAARKQILEGRTPGWFAGGEVYIYMPHLVDEVDLDKTVVHESVAHKGIKQMLGEEFGKFLDNVWNSMSVPAKVKFLSYVGAGKNATQADRRAAADEYVAAIAEKVYKEQGLTAEEKTIWQKFADWFRKKFNVDKAKAEVLAKETLTDEDIAKMIRASYETLKAESGKVKGESGGDFRARKDNEVASVDGDRAMFRLASSNASAIKYDKMNGTNVKEFFDFLRGGMVFEKGKPNVFHIANAGNLLEQYGIKGKFMVGQFTFSRTHTQNEDHNLGIKEWVDVINNLNNPLAITSYKGLPNEYRIYTYATVNGKNICVGVNVSLKEGEIELSNIISAYSRDINNLLGKEGVNLLYPDMNELKRRISQVSTAHNSLLNATSTASADKDNTGSAKKQGNGTKFRKVTPEMDAEYMAAVENGDMESAERLVKEAAKMAMPDTKVVDEDGYPMVVYHGTTEDFTVFDKTKGRANMDIQGMFFSPWDLDAKGYGPNVRAFFLDVKNPANESAGYDALKKFQGQNGAGVKAREYLVSLGYDGVNNEAQEFVAFEPNQIKSAAAVTYDDNGNVIPLSERFNEEKEDIRFRKVYGGNSGYVGYSMSKRAAEAREEGRFPKTDFKKEYGVTDKELKALVDAGIVSDREWHHTSMYGNKTTFYSFENKGAIDFFNENIERVKKAVKNGVINELVPEFQQAAEAFEDAEIERYKREADEQRRREAARKEYDIYVKSILPETYPAKNGAVVNLNGENYSSYWKAELNGEVLTKRHGKGIRDAAFAEAREYLRSVVPTFEDWMAAQEKSGIRFRKANNNQEIFVSNARKAVEEIKQEKATPEQWLAMIKKNGGLKAGEDAWMGLSEWLEEKGKRKGENGKDISLTKQEVLDFINENAIKIEEVRYSQFGYGMMDEAAKKLEAEAKEIGWDAIQEKYPGIEDFFEYYNGEVLWNTTMASIGEYEDFVLDNKIVYANPTDNAINESRESYTTEGLERKREIALVVPTVEPYNQHDEIHFGDAGNGRAVAWVRFGETTDSEGNRVLVIDEIQSKRHQDGREKGYKSQADKTPATMDELTFGEYNGMTTVSLRGERFFFKSSTSKNEILDIINERIAAGQLGSANGLVPDAPFEKNWQELAMKRMLRLAAEEGFDKVAWTTGEQQAERYGIAKSVESIDVEDNGIEEFSDGTLVAKNISLRMANDNVVHLYVDADGVAHGREFDGKHLSEVVGKDLALKIMQPGNFTLEGEGLKVGGEGMKGFYDKMLPSFVSKYTKKWGAKVGTVEMPNLEQNNVMHSVDVTPQMRESVMEGQTMFRKMNKHAEEFNKTHKGGVPVVEIDPNNMEAELAEEGFTPEDIQHIKERLKKGLTAVYDSDKNIIYLLDPSLSKEGVYSICWHENTHAAITAVALEPGVMEEFYSFARGKKREDFENLLMSHGYKEEDYPEESLAYGIQAMDMLDNWGSEILSKLYGSTAEGAQKQMEIIQPLIDYINNGRQGTQGFAGETAQTGGMYNNTANQEETTETEGTGATATGGLTEEEINLLTSATGYSREDIVEIFGNGETRFRKEIAHNDAEEVTMTDGAVTALGQRLNTGVNIVKDIDSLPENLKAKKGWYDAKTGEVVVVMDNHVSMEDAMQTVLHEVVGRKGLRAVMGEEFDALLDNVYKNLPKAVKSRINYVVMTRFVTPRQATDEYIAGLAGKNSQDAVLNDIMQRMGDYFRGAMNLEMEDGELRYMLWKNNQRKQTPNVVSMVQDRVMETETNTGDNGTRFRTVRDAKDTYEKGVRGRWNKVKEGHYDRLRSVRKAQEAIAAETGMPISDSEDVYSYAEHLPSINKIMKEQFDNKFLTPFVKLLKRIYDVKLNGKKLDEKSVERYTNAKHGLERNRDMAVANALTTVEEVDGKKKPVFNKDAYEDWQTKKAAILAENITWEEKQDKLDALAKTYGAKLRDYSGLTAIFDPEGKMKYKQLRDEAIKYVTEMEGAVGKRSIDELWKIIKGMTDFSLKQSYESGLLSKDMYESISKRYEYYVPLRGFTEETAEDYYDYLAADHTPLNSVIKRAEGRKSEAANIFATILNMANSAIVFGNKNRLKQRVLNLATRNKNSLLSVDRAWYEKKGEDVWELALPVTNENMTEEELARVYADFDAEMKRKESLGEAERQKEGLNIKTRVISDQSKAQHAIRVKRNGREYIVWVNASPTMANAVNGMLREEETGWALNAIDAINKFRSKMVTQFSPTFVLTNLFRDVQSASTVYGIRHGAKALGEFEKNVMSNSVKMMGLYLKFKEGRLDESKPLERYFKEFLENGGETGYTEMISIEEYNKALNKLTEGLNIKNATGRALEAAGEGIEFANRCVENLCRFSAYMTSRQSGMSILQSINDAKEVSVNFNRKGSGAMGAGVAKRLYMFYNPAVQALAQRYLLAKKYPKRMIPLLAGELALGAMQPILFATISALASSAFGDDDETWDEKFGRAMGRYYNLTDYRRRGSICLPLGDGVFNPPLAHESRVFFGLGELAASRYNGHETYESILAQAMDIIGQSLPLNPVEGWAQTGNLTESLLMNLTPDALKPFAENAINRDFAGNKIHNASDMNDYMPEYMRGKKSTAEIYNKISKLLSGGESNFERGTLDENAAWLVNPSKLEHLVEGYLGGAYTFAEKLVRSAAWAMGNEENADVRNVPFVSSFYTPIDKYEAMPSGERTRRDWEDAFEYYQGEIKLLDGKEKAAKRGEKFGMENATETLEAMKDGESLMIDVFNDGNKKLKELYADMDAARTAKNFDEVEVIDQKIYAQKRFITERMEQMAENPAVGYTFNTNKSEGPYGERETYGDVRDMNVINDFQKTLTPLFEAYKEELKTLNEDERNALFQKNEKMVRLYNLLKRKEQVISNNKKWMNNNPEKADEYMNNIRTLRAEAIDLINNYNE